MSQSQKQSDSIADLLYKAGLLTQDQLARSMAMSIRTSAPIGAVLTQTGSIPKETMRTANLVHGLLQENLVDPQVAAKAVYKAVVEGISLEKSLDMLGWRTDIHLVVGRLSQLLVESGVVEEEDLRNAIEASYASGLPLGRVLVLRQVVPEAVAYAALTAQVLVREGKISAEQAINALKLSAQKRKSIEESLSELKYLPPTRQDPIRLGELLIAAELVSEIDLLTAVEKGMSEGTPIGQILHNHGFLTQELLDKALTLQFMTNKRAMTPIEAVAILQRAAQTDGKDPQEDTASSPHQYRAENTSSDSDIPESARMFGLQKKEDWMRAIQELTLDKQNLAYKVVSQQEEMKNRLARELHDTIIADLMMLKRYLTGDKKLSTEETIEIVDHVVRQLRDICSDFAPRNFREWGLKMCLEDMLERMSQRTGIKTNFKADHELPQLPDPVGLHIFRIIQESLNNVEKYSGASEVSFLIEKPKDKMIRFILNDNGKGFDTDDNTRERSDTGGMGMGGMKERADLIRCFYPCTLDVISKPGMGSTIILELEIP